MNARNKDTFREIRKSFGRFLSILLIIAVGVGFFVGVKATAPSMYLTANNYFGRQDLMDLEILSTVGFGDEDVEKIREIDHVAKVLPTYSADLLLNINGENVVTSVMALPGEGEDSINTPVLVEGRMPETENECVLIYQAPYEEGETEVGKEYTFLKQSGDTDVDEVLKNRKFKVVGTVDLPQYISYSYGTSSVGSGDISLIMLIPKSNFMYPRYTGMFVTLDCKEQGISAFSEEYDAVLDDIKTELTDLGDVQYRAFVEDTEKQLKDAESEFDEGKQDAEEELGDAKGQLDDAKQQIEDGLAQLMQGWKDYEAGSEEAKKQIADAEKQIANYKKQIADGEKELKEAESELETAQRLLDTFAPDSESQEKYDAALAERDSAASAVSAAQAELAAAESAQEAAEAVRDGIEDYSDEIENIENQIRELESQDPEDPEIAGLEIELASLIMAQGEAEAAREAAQVEVNAAKAAVDAAQGVLTAAQAELTTAESNLTTAQRNLDYLNGYDNAKESIDQEVEEGRKEIEAGRKELEEGKRQLAEAEAELAKRKAEAEKELADAYDQLVSSEKELDQAQKEYDDGLAEYNEAVKEVEHELSAGMSQIQSARRELGDIVSGKWYVLSRDDIMVNYANFKMDAQRINAIADVFPVFFLLVAALVCLTTMSRMIDEQRIQMGTYKALGYKPTEIMGKYLIYAAIACIGGCIVGPLVCVQILPRVIFGAYTALYTLPNFTISIPYDMFAVSVVVALLCTVLVAFIACWKELRTTTAALMRPKSPKAGKKILLERIKPLWKCFSFFQKLTARNLFRYKVRLLMTVIGIAGCMALVVAGFGLNNAISPIVELQYDVIQHDDILINLDQNYSYDDVSEMVLELKGNESLEDCLLAGQNACKVLDLNEKNMMEDSYLYYPQNIEDADALLTLRNPSSHNKVEWSDDGAIVTEKIAKKFGVGVGDQILVMVGEEKTPVTVCGVSENYIYNYVYVTPEYYQKTFGKEPLYNMVFASESEKMTDRDDFSANVLNKFDQIVYFYYTDSTAEIMEDTMASMKIVVFVMILCAGILAFIVLFNLTNINLSERMREIATVKVLGFNHSETNSYIFRENIIMSIMGILFGCVLGYLMAQYLISTVEVNMVTFSRDVHLTSYLYSAGITMGFTILVNLFMTGRIKAISMVESLKAIE